MKSIARVIVSFVLIAEVLAGTANAQEPVVTQTPELQISYAQPQANLTWQEYELQGLELSARRSRNALIGLSASTVVGAALLFPGLAGQCFVITNINNQEELRCTRAGKALVGTGWPLFIGGALGVLISGIMFGVRQGKIRRLKRRIAFEKSKALRWDPARASFVF
jgi:hypothetical protein